MAIVCHSQTLCTVQGLIVCSISARAPILQAIRPCTIKGGCGCYSIATPIVIDILLQICHIINWLMEQDVLLVNC